MKQLILPAGNKIAVESQLTRWQQAEIGFERCTLLTRVMQGLCLEELRKLHGNSNRGNPKLRNSPQVVENWEDYVRKNWGFSDETARRLMHLAKTAKPRLRKLAEEAQAGLAAILDKPFSQLTESEFAALKNVTHKLTDAHSNRELQQELGLFKGDAPKPKGGSRNAGKTLDRRTDEEIAQAKAMEAATDWRDSMKLRLEEGIDETPFTWLTAEERTDIKRLMRDLLNLMGEPIAPPRDFAKERRILNDLNETE